MSARSFKHAPAVREAQRAFISLSGASGGGKTKSALELAQGLVSVTGGKVFVVDTENGRAKKYAPPPGHAPSPIDATAEGKTYAFEHVDFQPPFDPDAYLAALRHCEANGAGAVVFDSMSHEHAGEGGRLDSHDKITAGNAKKNYMAWRPNSDARNRLLWGGFFRSPCHIILCFRAKDKTEQRGDKIVDMGFTPIGGEDFIFEADCSILFMPQAAGVPTWQSDLRGERRGIKLPDEFRGIINDGKAISWRHGRRIAEWLNAGGSVQRKSASNPTTLKQADTPMDDLVQYAGETYDPAQPRALLCLADFSDAEVKLCGKALRALIQSAIGDDVRRAWFAANTATLLTIKARSPQLESWVRELEPAPAARASSPAYQEHAR